MRKQYKRSYTESSMTEVQGTVADAIVAPAGRVFTGITGGRCLSAKQTGSESPAPPSRQWTSNSWDGWWSRSRDMVSQKNHPSSPRCYYTL
ncbi:hypothetical protein SCLCIDRAFT_1221054 [Scleroderma citrinum Foug A]|uniref:Uncharacterized protein n=1 Tax=Scleroderma citrinum Foug A TaxID=1036808 RepID=A0A0C3DGV5_9AGAM|nr:hypothetical protein SCLCIDRAFT_1221054 [Scleroderma citrinum Foug A]